MTELPLQHEIHTARYEGEDTRPTTSLELRGWYAYSAAAEVFVICGVGSFLPVFLESLARENGVLRSDHGVSCVEPRGDSGRVRLGTRDDSGRDEQCVISPFGFEITTSSFVLYTFSLAVLVQVVVLVSSSALADYGNNRKKLLTALAFTGSICCSSLVFVSRAFYLLAPLLIVVSVTCLGSSFVLLNAYLPVYAKHHPRESRTSRINDGLDDDLAIPLATLEDAQNNAGVSSQFIDELNEYQPARTKELSDLKVSTQISARGYGIGYSAALLFQILSIGFLVLVAMLRLSPNVSTAPLGVLLFAIGVWWLLFSVLSFRWLRPRPGPPLPPTLLRAKRFSWLAYIIFSWKSTWETIKVACKLRQMLKFLAAWVFLSDALATMADTAVLFGKTELGMSPAGVATIALIATGSGVLGALMWPRFQLRYNLQSKTVILAAIVLFLVIPINGILGYLPFVHIIGIGGVQSAMELYMMASIHGIAFGGFSAYCRSFYGNLIPPGHEAAFYALYAFTDKGSSIIGPAVVGRIADATGSLRGGFFFIALFIAVPAPFIWWIDEGKGREEGLAMAKIMSGTTHASLGTYDTRTNVEEREELLASEEDS
ncbi:autophagy-related protein 22-1 [Pseudovirgaria hyperparasitica]|uniref:Autophagy-related protein n=1 Tax=Pseudovirgaria hyperparasitica TaxID=470096 RepID=A0A6A6W5T9_9PEZI|nr:autophagy-related protein 22-1 [Pseudovirgaria hyperparasitica]KAF2757316.1 autophagy-related protein 22-1 [Pseudovirgaria hyperparasitica]